MSFFVQMLCKLPGIQMKFVRGSERGLGENNEKSIQRDVSRWHTRKKNFQSEKMSQRKIFKMEMSLVIFFSLAKNTYYNMLVDDLEDFFKGIILFCR